MPRPITTQVMSGAQAVIWQPYTDALGIGEPALLVQRDATGLLVLTQEGREILIQPETLPALFKQLRRLAQEGDA